jgi:spermidine synthase
VHGKSEFALVLFMMQEFNFGILRVFGRHKSLSLYGDCGRAGMARIQMTRPRLSPPLEPIQVPSDAFDSGLGTKSSRTGPTGHLNRFVVACLLLVSGCCALSYQTIWQQSLQLVFGGSTAASGAVLAIFMGGLGAGNLWFGRRIDQTTNPLRLYAYLELGVAISAAGSLWVIDLAREAYLVSGGQTTLGIGLATAYRLLLATLVLFVPTFLMGGTLPAAAKGATSAQDVSRTSLALVYACNTLGALVGTGLVSLILIEAWGLRATLLSAAAVNFLLGMTAFVLSWLPSSTIAVKDAVTIEQITGSAVVERAGSKLSLGTICAAAGVSGFCFFLMEIVWFRMLAPILGGNSYTFGVILMMVLLGIGIGSFCYTLVYRSRRPETWHFSLTCCLVGLSVIVPYWWGDGLAIWVAKSQANLTGQEDTFNALLAIWFKATGIVVLPAAIVSGFQFPLLMGLIGEGDEELGYQAGVAFAANTLGSIAGALIGGFGLLPLLTAPGVWKGTALVMLVMGWWIGLKGLRVTSNAPAWVRGLLILVPSVLTVCGLLATGPTAVWRHSSIGVLRAAIPADRSANSMMNWQRSTQRMIVKEFEGVEGCIGLMAQNGYSFVLNGKSDGNAVHDAGTQIMLGLLGGMLHPAPKEVVVVGLGSGETAGWLAEAESVRQVDVIELEPAMLEVAKLCSVVNRNALANPKVQVYLNDAREFLLTSRKQYDLIVSEPSNPYRVGVANLFTKEFYAAASSKLANGGLFVQWLQGYEVDEETVKIVLRTLSTVFPKVEMWQSESGDMLLLCRPESMPESLDLPRIRERLNSEPFRSGVAAAWRVNTAEQFFAHQVASGETLQAYREQGAVNTDDRNLLAYGFARSLSRKRVEVVPKLRGLEWQAGHLSERLKQAGADVDRVIREMLVLDLIYSQAVEWPAGIREGFAGYLQVWEAYRLGRSDLQIERFQTLNDGPLSPTEAALMALGYGVEGVDDGDRFTEWLTVHPGEGAALEAIGANRRGDWQRALLSFRTAARTLQSNPWILSPILEVLMQVPDQVTSREPALAGDFEAILRQPFAAGLLNASRTEQRVIVSQKMNMGRLAEALRVYEPHAPWHGPFLELRHSVYDQLGDPLRHRAKQELEQFMKQAGK